jgi:hypothetical protein
MLNFLFNRNPSINTIDLKNYSELLKGVAMINFRFQGAYRHLQKLVPWISLIHVFILGHFS